MKLESTEERECNYSGDVSLRLDPVRPLLQVGCQELLLSPSGIPDSSARGTRPLTTGLAAATQRDRQSHERLLAFGQPSMRVGSGKVIAEARARYLSTSKVS